MQSEVSCVGDGGLASQDVSGGSEDGVVHRVGRDFEGESCIIVAAALAGSPNARWSRFCFYKTMYCLCEFEPFRPMQVKRILDRKAFYKGVYRYSGVEANGQHQTIL